MLSARPSSSTPRIAGMPIWTEKQQLALERHPIKTCLLGQEGWLGQEGRDHGWAESAWAEPRLAAWASLSRPARCSTVVIWAMSSTEWQL